ncbi:MAG: NAD(P)H-binding protein [Deltaproteobacteria bacterium]|nr:NAD(P)H-binding protein [Deltaproteobacteria bacterium]
MNILVFGASGNIGASLVERLGALGHSVRAFVRRDISSNSLRERGIRVFRGDLGDSEAIKPALEGAEAIINASYIVYAGNILKAASDSGARPKRIIYIGSTGIYTRLPSRSASDKRSAEELIRNSSVPYTVLRPTMVYGTAKDRNIFRLISFLHRYPLFPVFGKGENLTQPVYIDDVAGAVIASLNTPTAVNKSYDIGGRCALTHNELIDVTARKLGRKVVKVHLPMSLSVWLARAARSAAGKFPISEEQILRLNENKDVDISAAAKDFGYKPLSFPEGVEREIELFLKTRKTADQNRRDKTR